MAAGPLASWSFRSNGVASITVPLTGQNIQAGDMLHVAAHWFANINIVPTTPTDTSGGANTYNNNTPSTWSATFRTVEMSSRCESVVTAPTSVTSSPVSGTGDAAIVVFHVAFQSASPADTAYTDLVGTTSAPAHSALTTAQQYELVFCAASHDGANLTPTPPPGFTLGPTNFNGSSGEPYASAWRVFTEVQTALSLAWSIAGGASNVTLGLTAYKIQDVTGISLKSSFPKQVPR